MPSSLPRSSGPDHVMRVLTDPDVFLDDELFEPLVRFMSMVVEGRHQWDIDQSSERQAAEYFERHAPLRAPTYHQIAQKSATDAVYRPPGRANRPMITRRTAPGVVDDLGRPALVVLENQESDGTFLRSVFRAFDRRDLLEALARNWLVLRHAGGGGVMYQKIALQGAGEFSSVVRVCGFLDSDSLHAGSRTKGHTVAEQLESARISVLVLSLREVENYIPLAALAGFRADAVFSRAVAISRDEEICWGRGSSGRLRREGASFPGPLRHAKRPYTDLSPLGTQGVPSPSRCERTTLCGSRRPGQVGHGRLSPYRDDRCR
ncbi:hypothetical protein FAIPA1_120127 [Frankia sp. AiPs1]